MEWGADDKGAVMLNHGNSCTDFVWTPLKI